MEPNQQTSRMSNDTCITTTETVTPREKIYICCIYTKYDENPKKRSTSAMQIVAIVASERNLICVVYGELNNECKSLGSLFSGQNGQWKICKNLHSNVLAPVTNTHTQNTYKNGLVKCKINKCNEHKHGKNGDEEKPVNSTEREVYFCYLYINTINQSLNTNKHTHTHEINCL